MSSIITIKRGLLTNLPVSATLGELHFTTDTPAALYIGTGSGIIELTNVRIPAAIQVDSSLRVGIGVTPIAEDLEIGTGILIGDAAGTTNGTIRYTGTDFEGRLGGAWTSLSNTIYTADDSLTGSRTITMVDNSLTFSSTIGNFSFSTSSGSLISSHGSSLTVVNTEANEFYVEDETTAGISILTGNTGSGSILFGDSDDNDVGGFVYDHSANTLSIRAGGSVSTLINSSGVSIGKAVEPQTALDVTNTTIGSQIMFSNELTGIQGGFLTSVTDGQAIISGGANFNGTNWIARHTDYSILNVDANTLRFFGDTGLTPGNIISPLTQKFRIDVDGSMWIIDGITAPGTTAGFAKIYVDTADGSLKVKFGSGNVAVIAADA